MEASRHNNALSVIADAMNFLDELVSGDASLLELS